MRRVSLIARRVSSSTGRFILSAGIPRMPCTSRRNNDDEDDGAAKVARIVNRGDKSRRMKEDGE